MPKLAQLETPRSPAKLSEQDAREIAVEAYVYAYPLVLMEITRRRMTNTGTSAGSRRAPMNAFAHWRAFPGADFTDFVQPNADTLYSMLWFDVSREPLIIDIPDASGRYYVLSMLDMWTDVFAAPGSRTTGTGPQRYAIVGPYGSGAGGRIPGAVELRSPTSCGWIIGRVQTDGGGGPNASDAAYAFQNGITAAPLSQFGGPSPYALAPSDGESAVETPPAIREVEQLRAGDFFSLFARLARSNPPHGNDHPVLARLARLGLRTGAAFAIEEMTELVSAALEDAPEIALRRMQGAMIHTSRIINGWEIMTTGVGTYGTDYMRRASVAYYRLGANTVEDALYYTIHYSPDGKPLDSGQRYRLHFATGHMPPARAFWSVTLYNGQQRFAANAADRYVIRDRDPLARDEAGSIDVHVQRDDPGPDLRSTWLPTPERGPFSLTLRLYWPKPEALDGTWRPPALKRLPLEPAPVGPGTSPRD